jgi:hypothetical protein
MERFLDFGALYSAEILELTLFELMMYYDPQLCDDASYRLAIIAACMDGCDHINQLGSHDMTPRLPYRTRPCPPSRLFFLYLG